MSNKGKKFTHADLPRATQQRLKNGQVSEAEKKRLDEWLDAQTERNRVVALDGTVEIIAEELDERAVRYFASVETDDGLAIDSQVLVQLRNLLSLNDEQRCQVLQSFEPSGELSNPFTPVEKTAKQKKPK